MPGISPLDELRAAAKLTGPKMPPKVSPDEAMANAGILKQMQMPQAPPPMSPLTVDADPAHNYRPGDVTISGGAAGQDSYWGNSAVSQRQRQQDDFDVQQSQQLQGLQQAFEESTRQRDVLQGRSDADLFGGTTGRRMMAGAEAQGQAGNVLGELQAAGTFQPNTTMARERDLAAQLAALEARYSEPALINERSDKYTADKNYQARFDSAKVAHPVKSQDDLIVEAILDAFAGGSLANKAGANKEGVAALLAALKARDGSQLPKDE